MSFKIFLAVLVSLFVFVFLGLDFFAWLAWMIITAFIVLFLIKAVLSLFGFATSGTMVELEAHEGRGPLDFVQEWLKAFWKLIGLD